ncbi:unnamed protein product [Parnassius mnemosyne]|uniref:Reverse transcriptase n=1 Tax=Parnassius mnemosyne TaxID=213953 RepID=A0AAV1LVD5_9NEOP
MVDSGRFETDLKTLYLKRSSIKGRITKFKNYLDDLTSIKDISDLELSKCAMKLSRIESLFSEFEELQNQIEEKIAASDLDTELISRELIEQDFDNCISIGRSLVQRGLQPNQPSPHCSNNDSHFTSVNESEQELTDIDDQLSKFWELESVPQTKALTNEERLCQEHFLMNTVRDHDGRFCVGLPLRIKKNCLGNSYSLAKKRFMNLEKRFKLKPQLKELYVQFIQEYAKLGHLSPSPIKKPINAYFLPHHPVMKEKSESTRLRVVFDASAQTTSGMSVNDLQMKGPVIQDSLINILLRFRLYKYIISGDIEKMYRQVNVRESDRNLQLILWRDKESDPLQTLQCILLLMVFLARVF